MKLPRRLSKPGPVIEYLTDLRRIAEQRDQPALKRTAEEIELAVKSVLSSPQGVILLDLLDKAILERSIPVDEDPRALDAINAQSFIALDLRRIASNESDALENASTTTSSRGRGRTSR
ncbi:hypothetical protein [Tritonibacter mobilis]|uniref:hypothetical protein n=1 Tax=Tritonibacter mobilis TaxID=379347 RepID=UPI0013A54350|nr:hypothetical protein [Tritonibacter mobilis]